MEHFAQTNVFTWIHTVFAHLIIGCAIRYPKIGNLCYVVYLVYNKFDELGCNTHWQVF